MKFEWDSKKDLSNRQKHSISFDEALGIFDDPFALIAPDKKHSSKEDRNWLIGTTEEGKVLVTVYTIREGKTRLISARPASRKERRYYEASKRIPL